MVELCIIIPLPQNDMNQDLLTQIANTTKILAWSSCLLYFMWFLLLFCPLLVLSCLHHSKCVMCVYINKAKGEFFILDKMVRDFIFSMKTFINLTIKILLVNQIYLIFIIQVYVKQNWLLFFIFYHMNHFGLITG